MPKAIVSVQIEGKTKAEVLEWVAAKGSGVHLLVEAGSQDIADAIAIPALCAAIVEYANLNPEAGRYFSSVVGMASATCAAVVVIAKGGDAP